MHNSEWVPPASESRLVLTGSVFLAASVSLAISQAPLGSRFFFALAAAMVASYLAIVASVRHARSAPRRALFIAFAFALAFRAPLTFGPIGADSDMVRYVWDGRVQRLGYNPYAVVPADPNLAHTHDADTVRMPSRRQRTPYPPAAQLFFRMMVSVRDSPLAMKLALVACDVVTIIILWRWLIVTGRNQWLAIAYAWNPLVVLEIAHSGHIDALGALWIMASAYWLARQRTLLASIAFVLAVATKLLPIVLAPLYWRRVRLRDSLAASALLALLYLVFTAPATLPLGALPSVVAGIRFNGPIFRTIRLATNPAVAAAVAVCVGLAVAAVARWKLPACAPAAWAWPMAVSLAFAPVIYPWYLLYFTPFLVSFTTLPLSVWTITVIPVYWVWERAHQGGQWVVPSGLLAVEYGAVIAAIAVVVGWRVRRWQEPRLVEEPSGS